MIKVKRTNLGWLPGQARVCSPHCPQRRQTCAHHAALWRWRMQRRGGRAQLHGHGRYGEDMRKEMAQEGSPWEGDVA
jgi:hypothetical protein